VPQQDTEIIHAYEALAQLLIREGITSKIDIGDGCLLVTLPGDTAVRAFHPDVRHPERVHGHWVIEYGHASDDRQRCHLVGRPAVNFATLAQLIAAAILLTQLQAYPLS
jgi:hypothetical protein